MKVLGVIPSRYGSTRFPGKPLAVIDGKSMVQRVYEQAKKAGLLDRVIVATDDKRIYDHVAEFGGEVMMTRVDHKNGTERCAEVEARLSDNFDAVINIQGDEPYIEPEQINKVAQGLADPDTQIATLAKRLHNYSTYLRESIIKVVFNKNWEALYFSRSPIPFLNTEDYETVLNDYPIYKHIGIYGFKSSVLKEVIQLPPSKLEKLESLEQLRWMENGYKLRVIETDIETQSVDVPDDIERLLKK